MAKDPIEALLRALNGFPTMGISCGEPDINDDDDDPDDCDCPRICGVFEFDLGDPVEITASGETGIVIGRAEHLDGDNAYNVRYAAADGRAVEQWWGASALDLADTTAWGRN